MPDPVFGPLIGGPDVERAALDTLKRWAPTYLAWAEREHAERTGKRLRLDVPRSWFTSTDLDRWPEAQLPSVALLSTGLAEQPSRDGRGSHRAPFALGLVVVTAGRDRPVAEDKAKLTGAALRALLLQKCSLGGIAEGVDWIDERYDALGADEQRRQLGAVRLEFAVDVRDVVTAKAGPSLPDTDPPGPLPGVVTTEVEVQTDPQEEDPA